VTWWTVLAGYRARIGLYPRMLMGLANAFGLIDRERLVTALHEAIEKIAADPDDPLRLRLTETLAALPDRLRTDEALAARVEGAKEALLASPAVAGLLEDAAAGLRRVVMADLAAEPSELVDWITAQLDRARRGLAERRAEALARSLGRRGSPGGGPLPRSNRALHRQRPRARPRGRGAAHRGARG
jgi:hypothetical protein